MDDDDIVYTLEAPSLHPPQTQQIMIIHCQLRVIGSLWSSIVHIWSPARSKNLRSSARHEPTEAPEDDSIGDMMRDCCCYRDNRPGRGGQPPTMETLV